MIDCSPFGCRTGFHMIMWGRHSTTEIAKVIKASLEEIAGETTWTDVPGTSIEVPVEITKTTVSFLPKNGAS